MRFVYFLRHKVIEVLIDEITPSGIKKRDFEKVIEYSTAEPYQFLYINNHAKKGEQIRKNLTEIINLDNFKTKNKSRLYYNKINNE